ncbi:MAG: sporulation protein YqfD [Firmicutes bacterium]|nr:sporulation protein YqfD [Bacillota bacterium]
MLFGILSHLGGYVTVTLPEECLEKFINLAVFRGIFLWDIKGVGTGRVLMKVRLDNVQALRHVARMAGCRFKIINRCGLPFFIKRMRQRRVLVAGALVFVAALYLLSSFVWSVEVSGNNRVSDQVVEQVASQAGLKPGVFRWGLNIPALEKTIQQQVPGLAWVGVSVQGVKVSIKVVEKTLPPPDEAAHPTDLVAARDGLITELLVFSGQPLVNEGNTVVKGQVLIASLVSPPPATEEITLPGAEKPQVEQPAHYVRARGIVKARVWYEALADVKLTERGCKFTGREMTRFGIKIGDKEIILIGPGRIPYTHYARQVKSKPGPKWRNTNIPVELLTVKFYEEKPYINRHTEAEARNLAYRKALESIRGQLAGEAVITNKSMEELAAPEPGSVRVKAIVETFENIGISKPRN